jgi:hypothetical protein
MTTQHLRPAVLELLRRDRASWMVRHRGLLTRAIS